MSLNNNYDSALRGWSALEELREVLRYHNLIVQLIRRDILARYKRSVIGIVWTMLNPLGTMLILSVVFSRAFGASKDYAAFVLSGLVVWLFFSQSTNGAVRNLIWGEGLIKRIYMPRTAFAVSAIGVGLVNMILSLVPLLLVMLVTGVPLNWTLLLLPLPILCLVLFALGVALLVSTLAVYFADTAEIYSVFLLAWMYLSPILYPQEYLLSIPRFGFWLANLNPVYHLLNLFRSLVLGGELPGLSLVALSLGISVGTAGLGWLLFSNRAEELAYRL